MNVPIPPTDNLYKFAALSGIIIVIVAILSLGYVESHIALRAMDRRVDLKLLELEQRFLDEDVAEASAKAIADPAVDAALKERKRDLERKRVRQADWPKASDLWKPTVMLSLVAVLIMVPGWFLAWTGFLLWYKRLQRFEDEAIKARAASTTKQASS